MGRMDIEAIRRDTPGVAHRVHLNNAGAGLLSRHTLGAVRHHRCRLDGGLGMNSTVTLLVFTLFGPVHWPVVERADDRVLHVARGRTPGRVEGVPTQR